MQNLEIKDIKFAYRLTDIHELPHTMETLQWHAAFDTPDTKG